MKGAAKDRDSHPATPRRTLPEGMTRRVSSATRRQRWSSHYGARDIPVIEDIFLTRNSPGTHAGRRRMTSRPVPVMTASRRGDRFVRNGADRRSGRPWSRVPPDRQGHPGDEPIGWPDRRRYRQVQGRGQTAEAGDGARRRALETPAARCLRGVRRPSPGHCALGSHDQDRAAECGRAARVCQTLRAEKVRPGSSALREPAREIRDALEAYASSALGGVPGEAPTRVEEELEAFTT